MRIRHHQAKQLNSRQNIHRPQKVLCHGFHRGYVIVWHPDNNINSVDWISPCTVGYTYLSLILTSASVLSHIHYCDVIMGAMVSQITSLHCLLNRLFRRRSKETSKLRVTDLCAGNSPEKGEFPAQRVSNSENVSIWWRHHVKENKTTTLLDQIWIIF